MCKGPMAAKSTGYLRTEQGHSDFKLERWLFRPHLSPPPGSPLLLALPSCHLLPQSTAPVFIQWALQCQGDDLIGQVWTRSLLLDHQPGA